jgi:hypothetical protein
MPNFAHLARTGEIFAVSTLVVPNSSIAEDE